MTIAAPCPPPAALCEEAAAKWVEIVGADGWAAAAVPRHSDEIEEYCREYARKANAERKILAHGPVVADPRGFPVQSPWLAIANKSQATMLKIAARHMGPAKNQNDAPPALSAPPVGPVTGNKSELATALGVSLPTLSGWMIRYRPDFPVIASGSHGRSYVFDFQAVFDFLREKQQEQRDSKAEADEQLAQLRLPFDLPGVEAQPQKSTTKEELLAWELRKRQRQEAEAAGQLVSAAAVRDAVTAMLGRISRDTHALIRQLGREQNWPDALTRSVEKRLADQQRATVAALRSTLGAAPDTEASYAAAE